MFVVDRIEGNYAVIEYDDFHINVSLSELEDGVKEGDILYLKIDKEKTVETKQNYESRLFNLFKR